MTIASQSTPLQEPTTGSSIFAGTGAMAELCTLYEWTGTSIGCPDDWSPGLRATAAHVLAAPIPMILLWGEDVTQIYNDAYRTLTGAKHPSVFAAPVKSSWPEGWL